MRDGGGGGRVEVINGKGCSRLFLDFSASLRLEPLFPASPSSVVSESPVLTMKSDGPFSGLIICVTGLSKETRKQVKEATERLGGQYSPHLHHQCTHLVVQSFHGQKFEHALKYGPKNGLLLVTIGWFVDSVKRNVRLKESLYSVYNVGDMGIPCDDLRRLDHHMGAENSCIPAGLLKQAKQPDMTQTPALQFQKRDAKRQTVSSSFSGQTFYVDANVPFELCSKVVEALTAEGASLQDRWFIGCDASHVVCEGPSIQKYLGHSNNLVTPVWVLKSTKEKCLQRLVYLSADLARHTAVMLDNVPNGVSKEEVNQMINPRNVPSIVCTTSPDKRRMKVTMAKDGVRKRRNRRLQTCPTPISPITPGSLLDSICWTISEPTSAASIYTDSLSAENTTEDQKYQFFDAKDEGKESESSLVNLSRPLTESEKSELVFKGHFLTVMFPIDRFSEIGPRSRTFFSNKGFTCLLVLDHIHAFYQENMSMEEIEIAIHTDSRHADRLQSAYARKEAAEHGYVEFKRIDFIGSRRSFEMLKRVSGDNNRNVYELLIRA